MSLSRCFRPVGDQFAEPVLPILPSILIAAGVQVRVKGAQDLMHLKSYCIWRTRSAGETSLKNLPISSGSMIGLPIPSRPVLLTPLRRQSRSCGRVEPEHSPDHFRRPCSRRNRAYPGRGVKRVLGREWSQYCPASPASLSSSKEKMHSERLLEHWL